MQTQLPLYLTHLSKHEADLHFVILQRCSEYKVPSKYYVPYRTVHSPHFFFLSTQPFCFSSRPVSFSNHGSAHLEYGFLRKYLKWIACFVEVDIMWELFSFYNCTDGNKSMNGREASWIKITKLSNFDQTYSDSVVLVEQRTEYNVIFLRLLLLLFFLSKCYQVPLYSTTLFVELSPKWSWPLEESQAGGAEGQVHGGNQNWE